MKSDFRIASAYLKLLLSTDEGAVEWVQQSFGDDFEAVAELDYIPGKLVSKLFDLVSAQGIKSWVLSYGQQVGIATHGPLGFAALSAPDLCTSLQVLSDFNEVRSNSHTTEFIQLDKTLEINFSDNTNDALTDRWLLEFGMLTIQSLIEAIIAHPIGNNAVIYFPHSEPDYSDELEDFYGIKCLYQQDVAKLTIPASWAHIPSALHDEDLYRYNLAKCREIKLSLSNSRDDFAKTVKERLMGHFDRRMSGLAKLQNIPGLDDISQELHVSSRTLIRHLQRQDTSYKEILADVRLEQAKYLLKRTHFTAAEIGDLLGYQEAANFGRAFRRWTGETPTVWRRQA